MPKKFDEGQRNSVPRFRGRRLGARAANDVREIKRPAITVQDAFAGARGPAAGPPTPWRRPWRYSSCGVTTAGATYCWGRNHIGQLGNGTETNSNVPVLVDLTFSP